MPKLQYKIVQKDCQQFVYLPHVPQYLDEADMSQWLRETRDDDPDLYAQLVHAYVLLTKPLPHSKRK